MRQLANPTYCFSAQSGVLYEGLGPKRNSGELRAHTAAGVPIAAGAGDHPHLDFVTMLTDETISGPSAHRGYAFSDDDALQCESGILRVADSCFCKI
jgi:hypothetical protein